MRRHVIVILCATIGAVAGIACIAILGLVRHGSAPAASQSVTLNLPRIETVPCWFPLPAGRTARCGKLFVPEDWAVPAARSIALSYVVFPAAETSALEPLVYISGGPGEPAQIDADGIQRWWEWTNNADWLRHRDVVVFDQRGVGMSEPDLGCPELVATGSRLFLTAIAPAEADAAWAEAAGRCHQRLSASGIDLGRYNTAATAHDISALVGGLGYRRWSLLAVSYGTRVAFEFLREFPAGTRSVILDSVYPPGTMPYVSAGADAARALDVLVAGCAADPACKSANPDLGRVLADVIQRAAIQPVEVTVRSAGGPPQQAMLDDGKLVEVLFYGLYRTQDIRRLPGVITALSRGNVGPLAPFASQALETYESSALSHGLFLSVECHDEYPFNPPDAVRRAAAASGRFERFALANMPLSACPSWPVGVASELEQSPVATDVPILMLSGELDPITPPDWAKNAAAGMRHARAFRFPDVGHGVLASDLCADRVVASFLINPDRAPFDSCLLALGQLR
jgi:pimeloyl-ACP methyl ester carboxylesterase